MSNHSSPHKPILVHSTRSRIPEYLLDSPIADKYGMFAIGDIINGASTSVAAFQRRTVDEGYNIINLPSGWSSKDKCALLELTKGNIRANYIGSGRSDSDAAAVRANHPMPPQCGVYYFEVEIISKGRDGYIGIGFSVGNVSLNRLPGWEPNSYGYHGDDGHSFQCSGTGKPYGPTFTTGDVIGCCVNFVDRTAFYTKNGIPLGVAFRDLPVNKHNGTSSSSSASSLLYPSVGLRTPQESVEVNFGQLKFKFAVEDYLKEEKAKLWYAIHSSPIPMSYLPPISEVQFGATSTDVSTRRDGTTVISEANFGGIVNELILSYLVHHGYSETASLFVNNLAGTSCESSPTLDSSSTVSQVERQINEIKNRQQIRSHILEGDIDSAIAVTNRFYPTVLPNNEPIFFQLRCRKFIEMMAQIKSVANEIEEDFEDFELNDTSSSISQDAMDLDDPSQSSTSGHSGGMVGQYRNGMTGSLSKESSKKRHSNKNETMLIRDALKYGQELQNDYAHDDRDEVKQALVETFSLLAYPDPYNSAVSYLLDPNRRAQIADALNSAILVSQNQPPIPHIELMFKQAAVTVKELVYSGNGTGALVNVHKDVLL